MQQNFKIVPEGYLKDGQATVDIDQPKGTIQAKADLTVGLKNMPWPTKNYRIDQGIKVDPKLLLTKNLSVSQKLKIGNVIMTVKELHKDVGLVDIEIKAEEANLTGQAKLDLTSEVIRITSGTLNGSVKGHDGVVIRVASR